MLETATSIAIGTAWIGVTNFPATSSRAVHVIVPTTGDSRYFRLASLGTGDGSPLILHIAIPRAFTTNSAVLPAGNENSFGNGFNNVFFRGPINYQTFYGRSNLTNLKNHRITITGMAFRLDEGPETTRVDAIIGNGTTFTISDRSFGITPSGPIVKILYTTSTSK